MSQPDVYSAAHRFVHWATAALVIGLVPVGLYMASLPDPAANPALKNNLYELHKSFGLTVLVLSVIRVALKVTRGTPPPLATLTRFQRVASAAVHHLLYVLIFFVPLAGWLATSMCYGPVRWFWTIPVTLPFSGQESTCSAIYQVHLGGALVMTVLVIGHIGAALMHLVILRDGVFRRMWP